MDKEKYEPLPTISLENLMEKDIKVDWLIEGFLAKGCMAFVHGLTGVKRSFLLQQMALALATCKDFLGYRVPEPVKVLLYQQELTQAQVRDRAKNMLLRYPKPGGNLLFNENYGLLLDKGDGVGRLLHTIEKEKITVVILDPLYMLHTGDYKDEQSVMRMLNPLQLDSIESGRNYIWAAHSRKPFIGRSGNKSYQGIAEIAGAAAFGQIASYSWRLGDEFQKSNTGCLEFDKARDLPSQPSLKLTFDPKTYTFDAQGHKPSNEEIRVAWLIEEVTKRTLNGNSIESRNEAIELTMVTFDIKETQAKKAVKSYEERAGKIGELVGGRV